IDPRADRGIGLLHLVLGLLFPAIVLEQHENVLRHHRPSCCSTIGRISIPYPGQVLASATAAALSGSSRIEKPPTDSFASMNGPSTTVAFPLALRIVVAVRVGSRSAPPSV